MSPNGSSKTTSTLLWRLFGGVSSPGGSIGVLRLSSRGAAVALVSLLGVLCSASASRAEPATEVGQQRVEPLPAGTTAYAEQLVRRARSAKLASETAWLRLGHYRPGTFGGYQSEVDGESFFLATDGKEDPAAELDATLRGFFERPSDDPERPHPLCRFPARLMWLGKQLDLDWSRLPQPKCQKFGEYLQELSPDSLTLVFSSYYLNNPASAFGHTFLRVNKARQGGEDRQALLDYGIDFSATVDTNNALLYAAKGLLGMFPGVYRRIPYYYKVREYNDFESRDLWEYELSLPPDKVMLVLAHIWELGNTYFDYYYLSENCSYHVLGALEVADPELQLLEHVNWPAVPVDTIRALYQNRGLVASVNYRPSGRTQFSERLKRLTSEEALFVGPLIADPETPLPESFSQQQVVRILDTALDVADSKFAAELVKTVETREAEAASIQQTLLERRAKLLLPSEKFEVAPPVRLEPHVGHSTRRLSLGSGYGPERGAFHELQFRLALHDLADPPRGYPEGAQIEFMPLRLRYFVETPQLWLEDFSLVRVVSTTPWTSLEKPLSWMVRFGWNRIYDAGCDACLATSGEVGGGFTLSAFDDGLLWYVVGLTHAAALAPISGGIADLPLRAGLGPASGLRLRFTDDLVFLAEGRLMWLPTQTPTTIWRGEGTLRYQYIRDFALGINGLVEPDDQRLSASSILYF